MVTKETIGAQKNTLVRTAGYSRVNCMSQAAMPKSVLFVTSSSLLVSATLILLNRSRPNKSLDASGTSGLVIDNLCVTSLSPAASTQPFDSIPRIEEFGNTHELLTNSLSHCVRSHLLNHDGNLLSLRPRVYSVSSFLTRFLTSCVLDQGDRVEMSRHSSCRIDWIYFYRAICHVPNVHSLDVLLDFDQV